MNFTRLCRPSYSFNMDSLLSFVYFHLDQADLFLFFFLFFFVYSRLRNFSAIWRLSNLNLCLTNMAFTSSSEGSFMCHTRCYLHGLIRKTDMFFILSSKYMQVQSNNFSVDYYTISKKRNCHKSRKFDHSIICVPDAEPA
jgi:hypothetical protein